MSAGEKIYWVSQELPGGWLGNGARLLPSKADAEDSAARMSTATGQTWVVVTSEKGKGRMA